MSKVRKALFICGTPFHVISSIILRYQLEIEADIVIYDAFSNVKKLRDNLQREEVFDEVFITNRKKDLGLPQDGSLFRRYIYALTGYFKIEKLVKKGVPDLSCYTDVFFANDQSIDLNDRYIFCYLKKFHNNTNIHFMDDGLGAYNEYFYKPTRLDYFMRKFIIGSKSYINDSDVFLYSPRLFKLLNPSNSMTVHAIDSVDEKTNILLKDIFDYVPDLKKEYNTIVFDTVRKEDYKDNGSAQFNSLVLDLIKDEMAIVKPHPRDNVKYFDIDYFKVEGFPFELLCLKNDFSNYTFINNYSTAVFTPKLLFNQEPRIIFLYEALDEFLLDKRCDRNKFVSVFREFYDDKTKVIVYKKEDK